MQSQKTAKPKIRICIIENCESKLIARGMCHVHYKRWQKYRDPYHYEITMASKQDGYNSWKSMKYRVTNPLSNSYGHYGAIGVFICDYLNASFENFISVMGSRPSKEMTLDRERPEGNYTCGKCPQCLANKWPLNVRWADKSTQSANVRPTSKTGYKNIYLQPTGYYRVAARMYGEYINIGNFKKLEDAVKARDIKLAELGVPV